MSLVVVSSQVLYCALTSFLEELLKNTLRKVVFGVFNINESGKVIIFKTQ
jgi:hypothetical protein